MRSFFRLLSIVVLPALFGCNQSSDQPGLKSNQQVAQVDNKVKPEVDEPFYIHCIAAVASKAEANKMVKGLLEKGYDGGSLWIPDYSSLSGAKMYAVYLGPFKTKGECDHSVSTNKKEFPESHAKLVSNDKPKPIDGSRSENLSSNEIKEGEEEKTSTNEAPSSGSNIGNDSKKYQNLYENGDFTKGPIVTFDEIVVDNEWKYGKGMAHIASNPRLNFEWQYDSEYYDYAMKVWSSPDWESGKKVRMGTTLRNVKCRVIGDIEFGNLPCLVIQIIDAQVGGRKMN